MPRSTVLVVVRLVQTGGRRGFVGSMTQAAAGSHALARVSGVGSGPVDLLPAAGDGGSGAGRTAGAGVRDSRRLARRRRRGPGPGPGGRKRGRSGTGPG